MQEGVRMQEGVCMQEVHLQHHSKQKVELDL